MGTFIKPPEILAGSPIVRSIFEEMQRQRMTQAEMADILETQQARVSGWSRAKVEPGITKVEAMAEALGYRITLTPIKEQSNA